MVPGPPLGRWRWWRGHGGAHLGGGGGGAGRLGGVGLVLVAHRGAEPGYLGRAAGRGRQPLECRRVELVAVLAALTGPPGLAQADRARQRRLRPQRPSRRAGRFWRRYSGTAEQPMRDPLGWRGQL